MPESDSRDRERRKGSLLTLASLSARPDIGPDEAVRRAAEERRIRMEGAAERHHLARSRREAAPSPLVAALGKPAAPAPADTFEASNRALDEIFESSDEPDTKAPTPPVAPEPPEPPRGRERREEAPSEERTVSASPPPAAAAAPGDATFWRPLIDPMAVIGGIVRSRWIIAATTVCGAVLGAMIALSTPKQYVAGAELLVDPRDIRFAERELTAGGLSSDALLAIVENQVRVMMSGSVMNRVVERLGLDRDPEFNGQGGSGGLGSHMAKLRSLVSSGGAAGEGADNRTALAVRNLYRAVDAERGGRTFVVSVRAKTESPDKSALIVNTLTEVFLETYGSIQAGTAGRASDELSGRLSELRSSLEQAERAVEAYRAENDLVGAQGRLITDDEIVKLNDQLGAARARTLELDAKAASARGVTVDAALAGNLPEQISSPVLTDLRSQYAALAREAERAGSRLGPRHPERMALDAQLSSAREQIRQELRLVASSFQVELRRAVQLEQELAARLAQLKARQANISDELVTLRELERDANAKRAVYEAFLLRARETGEQRDLNTANITVISQATPPLLPTGMSRTTMTLAGAIMGFGAGVALGAGRGALDGFRHNRTPSPLPHAPSPTDPATGRARTPEEDEAVAALTSAEPEPHPSVPRSEVPAAPKPETASLAEPAEEADMHHAPIHPNWPIRSSLANDQPEAPYGQPHRDSGQPAQPMHPQWSGPAAYPQAYPYPPQGYAPQGYYHPGQPMQGHPAPAYLAYPHVADPNQPQGYHPQPSPYQAQPWQGPATPPQHAWPQHPAAYGQPWPQPPVHQQAAPEEPAHAVRAAAPSRSEAEKSAIDEIRESLREFREALRELAESRTRRRFL